MHDRLILRPFPRTVDEARKPIVYDEWRRSMVSLAGFSIFIAGNKIDRDDPDGKRIIVGQGCLDEFRIGTTDPLHSYSIPVGATGYAAREIWEAVVRELERYYGGLDVSKVLNVLGDARQTDDALVRAIFELVAVLQQGRVG